MLTASLKLEPFPTLGTLSETALRTARHGTGSVRSGRLALPLLVANYSQEVMMALLFELNRSAMIGDRVTLQMQGWPDSTGLGCLSVWQVPLR